MGDDSSIVQSARVSYGKGTKKVSTDEGLIKYLMRHWHSTPFEMCKIKSCEAPIFIARQWIRHRTANVNEYSARYSILDKEFYIPAKDQLSAQSNSNRQGRGDLISGEQADEVLKILKDDARLEFIDNMSFFKGDDGKEYKIFGEGGVEKTAKEFNKEFLGKLPLNEDLRSSADKGELQLMLNQIMKFQNYLNYR